jgi:hypothetical protein
MTDFYRFDGVEDFSEKCDQTLLRYYTGDCMLFDTNVRHRGVYDREHNSRCVIQFEFADRRKSDRLRNSGPIGPGNSGTPRFLIKEQIARAFQNQLLLDAALLRERQAEFYLYG